MQFAGLNAQMQGRRLQVSESFFPTGSGAKRRLQRSKTSTASLLVGRVVAEVGSKRS